MKYFAYERQFDGEWCGVLYYQKPPDMAKERKEDRTNLIEVPDDTFLTDMLGKYPAPVEKKE